MATITATSSASLLARASLVNTRVGVSSSPILGLPSLAKKGKVVCSMEVKPSNKESNSSMGTSAWVAAAAAAAATTMSSPAMALVDERMSTEGTGLPFGLSNNILGWLLVGVFALIWSLYFVYTSGLEEDEESGLSL
ncbi:photosystem II reaction center W protein, chloroplastic-like [Silene latifolia]|uniref:photosystem II reaction center W protein, chloroplastic-like n=1 Tax=Silene latifolia TaxID=37657 RepID=UPI003D773CEA